MTRSKILASGFVLLLVGFMLWAFVTDPGADFDPVPDVTPCPQPLPSTSERIDRYLDAQDDYAGNWASDDCAVMTIAFTGDLDRHRADLVAFGLDVDSGRYELVEREFSSAQLEAARVALNADWDRLVADWGVVAVFHYARWNHVSVWVEWSDEARAAELLAFLEEEYDFTGFDIVTGATKPNPDNL